MRSHERRKTLCVVCKEGSVCIHNKQRHLCGLRFTEALERVATVGAHTANPATSTARESNNKHNKLTFGFQAYGLYVTWRMCHREYMSHAHTFAEQLQSYMSQRYLKSFAQQSLKSGYQYVCMSIVDGWRNRTHGMVLGLGFICRPLYMSQCICHNVCTRTQNFLHMTWALVFHIYGSINIYVSKKFICHAGQICRMCTAMS